MTSSRILSLVLVLLCASLLPAAAPRPVPALSPAQQAEAQRLIDQVRRDPRGPYGPIRWYCEDGRVLPPQGVPCRPAGGFQHAAPGAHARQLASLNFDLARFLANMPFDQFFDEARHHHWPRQLVLFDYLVTAHNGWIYGRAWQRRGVRQAEDEEAAARRLLRQLLQDPAWVEPNYLLAVQLVSTIPHGLDTARTRRIRALSTQLADQDALFLPLRAKIHSRPGPEDIAAVEDYLRRRPPADPAGFREFIQLMREEYSLAGSARALPAFQKQLKGSAVEADLAALAEAAARGNREAFEAGSRLTLAIRRALAQPGPGTLKLNLADLQVWLLDTVFRYGASEGAPTGSRRERLAAARHWLRYATGAGLISFRQLAAIEEVIEPLHARAQLDARAYDEAIRDLHRTLEWARAAMMREFGPVQRHYLTIAPEAAELIDDLLRRSVALHLSRHAEELLADAEAAAGRRHSILGQPASRGVFALNPGVAIAALDLIEPGHEEGVRLDPNRIYVIPETLEDLTPVKGILTLDSGNALSHTQLLAANLGIPNATFPSSLLPELRKHKGQRLFYAVTPGGDIILRPWNSLSEDERSVWTTRPTDSGRVSLDTSRLRLDVTRVIPLREISAADSGVLSGPKAANVGELARRFPGLVSNAVVVPFGIYHQHLQQAENGQLAARIRAAFEEAERLRNQGAPVDRIREFIYPQLAAFRRSIRTLPTLPEFERDLAARLEEAFGPDGSYGVFVRSDTNAEDLPQFTGAGLNLTVPNVVGRTNILQAVRDVWASPFEERAFEWRSRALESSAAVFPSVLIQRTVNSEKSGVLVTVNLETLNREEITVNVNEGVAAVVDGGTAESLLLRPDGSVKLRAQARSPYRRVALPSGGFDVVATTGADSVLQPDEIRQLRELAAQVEAEYPKARDANGETLPWDIEFGFENGQLRLFQIRPLVRFRERATLERLARLEGPPPAAAATVNLDAPPESK
ncbi:MAG: hypothetical protein KJZ84_16385 [Bryobacteraceae bacterium]|nr:hypothetical protein [Bryobacteraceae bacterium]